MWRHIAVVFLAVVTVILINGTVLADTVEPRDTVSPLGTFTGNNVVVKLFGQRVTGTATDEGLGIANISLSDGSTSINSTTTDIVLSCNASTTSCTWSANPNRLFRFYQPLFLTVTDKADNSYQIARNYTLL